MARSAARTSARRVPTGRKPRRTWTKDKLLERAREVDLVGRSSMNKGGLVKALRRKSQA